MKFVGKKMSTSHRVITCIPRAIQTDGRRLASWKGSLRGEETGETLAPKTSGYATSSSIMFSLLSRWCAFFQSDRRRLSRRTPPQSCPTSRDEHMFETSKSLRGRISSNR